MSEKASEIVIGVGPKNGLGASLAEYFSMQGLHCVIAGRIEHKLKLVVEKIKQQGGMATAIVADATVEKDLELLCAGVQENADPLELAVYNVDR